MTLEVVHRREQLAPKSGVEFMAPISRECVKGLSLGLATVLSLQPWRPAPSRNKCLALFSHVYNIRSGHFFLAFNAPQRTKPIVANRFP